MPKMHYFSNKFSKIAKRWGYPTPVTLKLRFWWSEVTWCGQIVFFQADYDEIELQKNIHDVILVTSSPLRHRKNVTEKRHQNNVTKFFHFGPPSPIKISGYVSAY